MSNFGRTVVYFNDNLREKDISTIETPIELIVDAHSCEDVHSFPERFDSFLSILQSKVVHVQFYGKNVIDSHNDQLLSKFIFQLDNKVLPSLRTVEIIAGSFSSVTLNKLCSILNPDKRRPEWTSLGIIDCRLEPYSMRKLIESLQANTNVREINISGNLSGDVAVIVVCDMLTKFENNIHTLNLSNNRLTNDGFAGVIKALNSVKNQIAFLSLSNHKAITSIHLDHFFSTVMITNHLATLDLYGCSIQDCSWARYLPFIRSLRRLSLAHNLIDDAALVCLCHGLTHNSSIVDIDISHNHFLSYGSHALHGLFETNRCLQSFAMRSNVLKDRTCWKTIGVGLATNPVLTTFDASDCGLTLQDVEVLCGVAYQQNSSVTIILHDNRLPLPLLTDDPRHYFLNKKSQQDSENQVLALAPTAQVDSLNASTVWRRQTEQNIRTSLEAASIVDEQGHVEETAITSEDEFEKCLFSLEMVEKSPFYYSPSKLTQMIQDMQQLHSNDLQTIQIAFGRADVLLGSVQIDVNCMYCDLRILVQPLVIKYMAVVSETERANYMNYTILNCDGQETDGDVVFGVKSVWADVRHRLPRPFVVLRPSSWIKIDED